MMDAAIVAQGEDGGTATQEWSSILDCEKRVCTSLEIVH